MSETNKYNRDEENNHTRQTNNTLYEKKHRYMLVLKELNILKAQIDNEVLNDGLSKVHSQEIHDIYSRIIVGLIEEGVSYQYVKDAKDSKKDKIKLYIDGNIYECRNIDIKEILKDRYDDVMKKQYNGLSLDNIKKLRDKNADPELKNKYLESGSLDSEKKDDGIKSNDVKNLLLGIKDAISAKNEQAKDEENKEKGKKRDVVDYVPPKIYLNEQDEKRANEKTIKKRANRFTKLMRSLLATVVVIGAFIFGVCQIPGIKENIINGWTNITNTFENNAKTSDQSITNNNNGSNTNTDTNNTNANNENNLNNNQ